MWLVHKEQHVKDALIVLRDILNPIATPSDVGSCLRVWQRKREKTTRKKIERAKIAARSRASCLTGPSAAGLGVSRSHSPWRATKSLKSLDMRCRRL